MRGTIGGLIDYQVPLVCGGANPVDLVILTTCYKYGSGHWVQTFPMVMPRIHFSGMPLSPFHNASHKFSVVGHCCQIVDS